MPGYRLHQTPEGYQEAVERLKAHSKPEVVERLFKPHAESEVASELRKLQEEIAALRETLGECAKTFLIIGEEAKREFRRLNGP